MDSESPVRICKVDEDERLVFGWASIATDTDGAPIADLDGDVIEPSDLEHAVYDYVLKARTAGEQHAGDPIGQIVESLMMTPDKAKAMGIEAPTAVGWWVGVKVDDAEVFAKVKDGTYKMFSIEGTAEKEEMDEAVA